MPNWCFTTITAYGPDTKRMHDDIESWAHDAMKNDFGGWWLGNMVINSGLISPKLMSSDDCPRCRGSITYMDMEDEETLRINQEDAWVPNLKMWKMIINHKKYDVDFVYTAEEPGLELYSTNDPTLRGYYVVDYSMPSISSDCAGYEELSRDATIFVLKDILKKKGIGYEERRDVNYYCRLLDENLEEDEYLSVHEYDFEEDLDVFE